MKMWRRGGTVKGTKIVKVVPENMKRTCVCDKVKQVHGKLATFCWASAEINLSEYFCGNHEKTAFEICGRRGPLLDEHPMSAAYGLVPAMSDDARDFFMKAREMHQANVLKIMPSSNCTLSDVIKQMHKLWRHQKLLKLWRHQKLHKQWRHNLPKTNFQQNRFWKLFFSKKNF